MQGLSPFHSSNMYVNERHTYQTLPDSEPYAAGESLLDVSIRTISAHIPLIIVYIAALFSFRINIHGIDIVSVRTMSAVARSNIVDISSTLPNLEGMSSTIQRSNSGVPRRAAGSELWGGQWPPTSYLPGPAHNLDQCVTSHHTHPTMRHTLDGGQDMCVT